MNNQLDKSNKKIPLPPNKYRVLAKEIAELINKHSMEKESNTPDYILGNYLVNCLLIYNATIKDRSDHDGRELGEYLKTLNQTSQLQRKKT